MKAALNLNIARALCPDDKILATSSRGDDTDPSLIYSPMG
jgi:hypothetical protein